MTSRERLLTVLRGGQADRVPVTIYEYSPFDSDWVSSEASYAPLLDLERGYGDSFVRGPIDYPIFIGDPNVAHGSDERKVGDSIERVTELDTPKGTLRTVTRQDPGLMTYWKMEPLIKSDADIEKVLSIPEPPAEINAQRIRDLEAEVGEEGILLFSIGDAIGHVVGLFDFEDFVMRSCTDEGPIRALLDKAQGLVLKAIETIGAEVDDGVFRLWGPEYCAAPLMNPHEYFRRFVVEYDRRATEAIHATNNFCVIHSHGRLHDILDMMVEIGADALEPIETLPISTADVTLAEVKGRIGDKMCLMGAVQAHTLETGSPDD
ncbi:MAG: uroporphyrinogen decarboxylase family protein, partial [Planctomycetota bacterium]